MNWRSEAICPTVGLDTFFPRPNKRDSKQAKEICFGCPARAACLHEALTVPLPNGEWVQGIFGGTTERERRLLRAREAAA